MGNNEDNTEKQEPESEEKRTIQVGAKVSESEYEILKTQAKGGGYRSVTDYIRSVAVYEHPKLRESLKLIPEMGKQLNDLTAKLSEREIPSIPKPLAISEDSDKYDIAKDEDLNAPKNYKKETELTEADKAIAGSGINILRDTGTSIEPALEDTSYDTNECALKEIEEDVNLDSFGSGSGLLDLSLQADDTSLGGILDEIYAPEMAEEAARILPPDSVKTKPSKPYRPKKGILKRIFGR